MVPQNWINVVAFQTMSNNGAHHYSIFYVPFGHVPGFLLNTLLCVDTLRIGWFQKGRANIADRMKEEREHFTKTSNFAIDAFLGMINDLS